MDEFLDAIIRDDIDKVTGVLTLIISRVSLGEDGDEHVVSPEFQVENLEDAFVQAAYSGSLKCLKALYEFVPDINCQGRLKDSCPDYFISPLRAAVEGDRGETVLWLCANGAKTNRRECIYSINYDAVISGLCFSNNCSVSCFVPLHFVHSSACAEMLLDHGADINAQDCMSKTPLSMATLDGRLDVVETLCKRGAHVGLGSNWGATPLVYAQYARKKEDRIAATQILCRFGANVNFQDRNGRTALHVAKDVECLRILLSYGGDPSVETIFGKTPIITAAENDQWPLVWLLCDSEPRPSLGLISRGASLFTHLPLNIFSWLLKTSNGARDLKHLCRCVIRTSLLRKLRNLDDAISTLPVPTRIQLYLALWNHLSDID